MSRDVINDPLVERLEGVHVEEVTALAFSPNRDLLSSASWDKTISVWDVADTASHRLRLEGHEREVTAIAFSPDGRLLASASWDRTVRLWPLIPEHSTLSSGSLSPSSIPSNVVPRILRGHEREVTIVAFSPDGNILASVSWSTIKLWDVYTGQLQAKQPSTDDPLQRHSRDITGIDFSPDGRVLASTAEFDTTIRIWSTETGEQLHIIEGCGIGSNGLAFINLPSYSTTSDRIGGDEVEGEQLQPMLLYYKPRTKKIKLCNPTTGLDSLSIKPRRTPRALVFCSLSNNNEVILAVASGSCNNESLIELWDTTPSTTTMKTRTTFEQRLTPLSGMEEGVERLTFSSDGKWLVSTCWDMDTRLWNVETGEQVHKFDGDDAEVCAVAFTPGNDELLVAMADDKDVVLTRLSLAFDDVSADWTILESNDWS